MTTKIQKWGNSLAVRLPREITEHYRLTAGVVVTIVAEKKQISIRPMKKARPTIDGLAQKISPTNMPELLNWGKPKGKEVW